MAKGSSLRLGWDSLVGQEETNVSVTSRAQVAAVSLAKYYSGSTRFLKHHRDHLCLYDLVVLGALEAAVSLGMS